MKGAIFSMLEAILVSGVEFPAGDSADEESGPPGGDWSSEEPVESEAEATEAGVWSGKLILDLYAGTGALGIEALSRGAARAEFVDSSLVCQRLIRENLRGVGLADRGRAVVSELPTALERGQSSGGPYDLVLLDPPYGDPSLESTLVTLEERGFLAPMALVVVEHSRRVQPTEAYGLLRLIRRRRHGDTEISIYRRE